MASNKKYRGSSLKRGNMIEMYGVSELLNKIEKAKGNVDEAVKEAVKKSLEIVGEDSLKFMEKHQFTGETLASYTLGEPTVKDDVVNGVVGYDVKKGGLPAIFLDVGTPSMDGYYWKYYAVNNNYEKIKQIQHETLNRILEELTK